jgi:hypothetical protein
LRESFEDALGARGAAAFDEDEVAGMSGFAEEVGRFLGIGGNFAIR